MSGLDQDAPSFDDRILQVVGNEIHLLAGECQSCARRAFPACAECPWCGGVAYVITISEREPATIHSYTVLSQPFPYMPDAATIIQADVAGVVVPGLLMEGEAAIGLQCHLRLRLLKTVDGVKSGFGFVRSGGIA